MPAWTKRRARTFATGWNVCEAAKKQTRILTAGYSHAVRCHGRLQQCSPAIALRLTTRNSRYSPAGAPWPRGLAGQGEQTPEASRLGQLQRQLQSSRANSTRWRIGSMRSAERLRDLPDSTCVVLISRPPGRSADGPLRHGHDRVITLAIHATCARCIFKRVESAEVLPRRPRILHKQPYFCTR